MTVLLSGNFSRYTVHMKHSKRSVSLEADLVAEVESMAKHDGRSFSNMVEVLLKSAINLRRPERDKRRNRGT